MATIILNQLLPSSIFPPRVRYVVIIIGSLLGILPYLADRLIAPRLKGFTATLVFPVTFTAWEFATLSINPMGTFGAMAYSQYGNLPLMQLASVTGLSGLTFMITWFASTVNWIWERSFSWPVIRRGVAIYAAAMGFVLLYGGARLAFHASSAGTMQIACFSLQGIGEDFRSLARNDGVDFRQKARGVHDRYFDETHRQADSGAQLILWPEAAGICASEDENALIERGRQLAREKHISQLANV